MDGRKILVFSLQNVGRHKQLITLQMHYWIVPLRGGFQYLSGSELSPFTSLLPGLQRPHGGWGYQLMTITFDFVRVCDHTAQSCQPDRDELRGLSYRAVSFHNMQRWMVG
jgi:hypothetical protein